MFGLRNKTDFNNDVVQYGPIGENRLKEILSDKGHRFEDVGENPDFRLFDVDIIQIDSPDVSINDVLEAYRENKNTPSSAVSYEVKTDTFGYISRNIVYEVVSNTNPGCLARSKADFLYYVFLDKKEQIKEEFLINVKKLRWWLTCNFSDVNKSDYLKAKSMRRNADNTAILLINIDKLIEDKVASKLN